MSISSDGILFYGFLIDEDKQEELERLFDYDETGIEEPEEYYAMKVLNKGKVSYEEYSELDKKEPCEIGMHCSYDYPMYYVGIKESELRAWRGYPKKIESFDINKKWNQQIKDFCKIMGIEYQEPDWYLASMYG